MTEPEVSLYVALYAIQNRLTAETVRVSIDGAHRKCGTISQFDIEAFLKGQRCRKIDSNAERWQGEYAVEGFEPHIMIHSEPGKGDVVVHTMDQKIMMIESKKGKSNHSSSEYPLMREAIGQLMTNPNLTDDTIPIVAVPYSPKSYELANRWIALGQIQSAGIRLILVHEGGEISLVGGKLMTDQEMIHKWLCIFGKAVDEKIIKEHITSYGNHLWHLFTWGRVSCITGDAARMAFDQQACTEVIRFLGGYSNSIECLAIIQKLSANELDNSNKSDIYIVANDFSWTYVRTHEDSCGPYFCTK